MATTNAVQETAGQDESQVEFLTLQHESNCTRCGGLMVRDFCTDLLSGKSRLDCASRRCVQCGDIVDPVIRWNRHLQQMTEAARLLKTAGPIYHVHVSV